MKKTRKRERDFYSEEKKDSLLTNTKNKINGITLIALVVTIIVLLILAGVSIATLTGDNGILTRASKSKENTEEALEKESIELAVNAARIGNNGVKNNNGICNIFINNGNNGKGVGYSSNSLATLLGMNYKGEENSWYIDIDLATNRLYFPYSSTKGNVDNYYLATLSDNSSSPYFIANKAGALWCCGSGNTMAGFRPIVCLKNSVEAYYFYNSNNEIEFMLK